MRIAILLLAALLSGCGASQAEMIAARRQACLAYGYALDSPELTACVERASLAAVAADAQVRSRTNVVVNNSNPHPVTCGPAFC
jgi:hypothetical protein